MILIHCKHIRQSPRDNKRLGALAVTLLTTSTGDSAMLHVCPACGRDLRRKLNRELRSKTKQPSEAK